MTEPMQTILFREELLAKPLPGWQTELIYWTKSYTARFVFVFVVIDLDL